MPNRQHPENPGDVSAKAPPIIEVAPLEPASQKGGAAAQDSRAASPTLPAPARSRPKRDGHDDSRQGAPLVGIPESQFSDFLVQRAADIVNQRSARREAIYRALIGVVVAGLVYLGYTDIRGIRADVTDQVLLNVQAELDERVNATFEKGRDALSQYVLDRLGGQMDARIALVQLTTLARELNDRDKGFSNTERDAVVALLRKAASSEAVKNEPSFLIALEDVFDTFFSADLHLFIDLVDDLIGDIAAERSPGICQTLVTHYGMRVIGAAETDDVMLERFERYVKGAYYHKYPEMALPFQIGFSFREHGNQRNAVTDAYFEDVLGLKIEERESFLRLIQALSRGDDESHIGKLIRIGRTFKLILEGYAVEIERIRASIEAGEDEDAGNMPADRGRPGQGATLRDPSAKPSELPFKR